MIHYLGAWSLNGIAIIIIEHVIHTTEQGVQIRYYNAVPLS